MRVDTSYPDLRATLRQDSAAALVALFERMQPDVAARYDAGARVLIARRWITEMAGVVLDRHMVVAAAIGGQVAEALDYPDFDPAVMAAWLELNAGFVAEGVTSNAEESVRAKAEADKDVEDAPSPVAHVFGILTATGALSLATQMTTTVGNFAVRDTAVKSGAAVKVWRTTSADPRKSHARMNGESVGLDEKFSNGLMWPGDPEGDPEDVAECKCSLTIVS
jgi:hypothetical protein